MLAFLCTETAKVFRKFSETALPILFSTRKNQNREGEFVLIRVGVRVPGANLHMHVDITHVSLETINNSMGALERFLS